jgi:hypothetical protein
MADINLIIANLNIIASAQYMGPQTARPTLQQQSFDRLQGSAAQVAAILTQNPNPNPDQQGNITAQFAAMEKAVTAYSQAQFANSRAIVSAFSYASTEWQKLVDGR